MRIGAATARGFSAIRRCDAPGRSAAAPDRVTPGDRYFATDLSLPLLERERDPVTEPGYQIANAGQVQGDTYALPYETGTADFVFTSCHPPVVSSSPADRIQAFGEVARVLKPGGEFILFPWDASAQHPAVAAFIDRNFERVDARTSPYGRQMVALRKRDAAARED